MNNATKHINLMDYARGVAILAVLLFHTLGIDFGYDALPWHGWFRDFSVPTPFLFFLPLSVGNLGVPVFFVISGFCIHLSFQQQGQKWGRFFIRRAFRIYPAYAAALIFCALLLYGRHFPFGFERGETWEQLIAHALLIHNYAPTTISGINGAFWSLAVEAQLYLLYPVLLFLVGKWGWRGAMILLAVCEVFLRGLDGLVQPGDIAGTAFGWITWAVVHSPLGYWCSWALGAYLADAFLKRQPLPLLKQSPIAWLLAAAGCYFIKPLASFPFLFFAVATAAVLSRLLSRDAGPVTKPSLPLAALRQIGIWSYSIYLLHQRLLQVGSYAIGWALPDEYRSAILMFLLELALALPVILVSTFWFELFEKPGIAWGKQIIRNLDARLSPSPTSVPRNIFPTGLARYVSMLFVLLLLLVGTLALNAGLSPRDPVENNNLAWSLATNPDPAKRDGIRAVKFAETACRQSQFKQTAMVGTLAVAYAEAGRFNDAISTAQLACRLAQANGETNLLQRNEHLLALYRQGRAYHETATNNTFIPSSHP